MTESTALDPETLIAACDDSSEIAGMTISTDLEPLGGPNAPIRPATYAGGVFQVDRRWWGEPLAETRVIVIDSVPSQANRLESALSEMRLQLGLPEIILDLGGMDSLPPHLPRRLSSFKFPHRQADAYLRDAVLDGEKFESTAIGRSLFSATSDSPDALFRWFPQAMLFGYWQSHLGTKRSQAKLARSWVSEIAGYAPASPDGAPTATRGTKGDPLNLSISDKVEFDDRDQTGWTFSEGSKKAGGSKKSESLGEIGHGQIPFDSGALAGVSFRAVQQQATVSFAGLRRIRCVDPATSAAGRALLAALGIAAHAVAFGRPFSLRSGCDLRPAHQRWRWIGPEGEAEMAPVRAEAAVALVAACAARARASGLLEGGGWDKDPLILQPNESLRRVIAASWPLSS